MEDKKTTFFKGVSVQTIVTALMGILEILVFAIMSRLLTKEDFGYFAALTGIMTICTSITEAGLGASIVQKKDASEQFLSTAFTLSLTFGLIGSIAIFILSPWLANVVADDHILLPMRVMSINIFLACSSSVGRNIMLKGLKFKQIGVLSVVAYTASSIIGISMAFYGMGLWSIVSISIINLLLFNALLYTRRIKLPKLKIHKQEVRGIVSYGGWLTLSVITNNITQQMDRIFLTKWTSVMILGAYNRPAGFVGNITNKINGIFDTVLFPMLSDMQNNKSKVQEVFLKAIAILNSFAIVLFAIFFFNAELIITIFFGNEWLELVPALRIISVFVIFNVDNRLVDCFFRSLGLVKLGFQLRVISAIITFISLYVGSKYGVCGVATALVTANVTTVIMKMFFLTNRLNLIVLNVIKTWIIAEKPILPLLLFGIPYIIFIDKTLLSEFLFASVMGMVILAEFLFLPSFVGKLYTQMIYPSISKVLHKIK